MSYTGKRTRRQAFGAAKRSPYQAANKRARKFGGAYRARPQAAVQYGSTKAEKKVSDLAVNTYQVNTTGSFTLLHVPVLGSDYTQRIGRKTLIKNFYIRGRVAIEAALDGALVAERAQQARMIVFLDMQPNGAAPAVTDLLNTADPASHLNLNNRDRFKILKDKYFEFDPYYLNGTATTSAASLVNQIKSLRVFKPVDIETIFNGTNGGTIADITSGALYMFWIGSQAAGSDVDINAVVATRVRYIDN